ncbi:MAG: type II secretion system F family protein [Actinomycetota bacterium]|nr:type II secretion system F family protein [Actinomycetota bacterium]
MSTPVVALAGASAALICAGVAGLFVKPTPRLAARVRPYTIVARAGLGRSADVLGVAQPSALTRGGTVGRLFLPPLRAFAARMGRLVETRSDEHLRLKLRQAGFHDLTTEEYRIRALGQAALFTTAGAAIGIAIRSPLLTLLLALCGLLYGSTRWKGRIDRAIEDRRERVRLELYTVNQMLAIHLRTGAGPVQATQRIVDRGTGAMVEELDAVLTWIRSGVSEPEAFRRAAELTPEPSAARTYKLFAAGAERGVDLAGALRALSEDLRDSRREDLRRVATKRRAAMLVPTIAILAPIMLLFIAAPLPSVIFGSR